MGFGEIFAVLQELFESPDEERMVTKPVNPCQVCGTTDDKKPQCFRGEKWCCENHRKKIVGDPEKKTY